jgi:hypothetical protein
LLWPQLDAASTKRCHHPLRHVPPAARRPRPAISAPIDEGGTDRAAGCGAPRPVQPAATTTAPLACVRRSAPAPPPTPCACRSTAAGRRASTGARRSLAGPMRRWATWQQRSARRVRTGTCRSCRPRLSKMGTWTTTSQALAGPIGSGDNAASTAAASAAKLTSSGRRADVELTGMRTR